MYCYISINLKAKSRELSTTVGTLQSTFIK